MHIILLICSIECFTTPPWSEEVAEVEEEGLKGSVLGGR